MTPRRHNNRGTTAHHPGMPLPIATFPVKALDTHLRNLLRAGHRVAVCDQVEDPALAKGLVRREVTRVVTPGTLTEDDLLDPRQSNHLVALAPLSSSSSLGGEGRVRGGQHGSVGVAWADLSTGQFHAADTPRDRLLDELARLAPSEGLCPESPLHSPHPPLLTPLPH